MSSKHQSYYVPAQSSWPIVGAISLFLIAVGAGLTVQGMNEEGESSIFAHLILLAGFFVSFVHVCRLV